MPQNLIIPNMNIATIYIAVLVLMLIPLIIRVVMARQANQASIGDKGNPDLTLRIRVHGNFAETSPFAIGLLLALPLVSAPLWVIHVVGAGFIAGRLLHAFGLDPKTATPARKAGMALTFITLGLGALVLLWRALL